MELLNQFRPDIAGQSPKGGLFAGIQIEQTGDMLLWNDEGVAFGQGKGITQGNTNLVLQEDFSGFQVAEWTGHARQFTTSDQMAKAKASADNSTIRQRLLKRPDALLGDLGLFDEQHIELRQLFEVLQPGIRDPRGKEV